ncbi:hypothetical protein K7432_013768 [Basidiobolus ranarum]|uniref:Uncharacterized protein n=1 Tax=Basidiobolus ranarum TaxID=34480 RepID=A0ABR2VQC0_9FUNG
MEIRSGTEGVPIPISEGNPYRTQRIPYPPHPSELINARPINREHSPDLLPRMSGPKPTYLEHSYYPGGANVNSPHGQPPTELLNPPNHIYEKPPMESETYRGNYPYNRGGFSGAPNGPRESYTSRDYSNYAKYPPPIQRDYVSHEREHTPNLNRLGPNGNDPVYRRTRENLPEGHPHWNPIESTLPPQRYPPSSMNYLENREFATAVTPERAPSFPRREEFLGAGQHRNLHFSEMDRGMEIKLEDVRNEQKVRNSSPLALDKVVENCRMLSHFAFEYGNRSEKVYPCPSDSLVREMAAKAQAILRVLTGLRSEGVKSGDRNEQALDDDDMEYIRNKRTLLAPSRPKYRKRSVGRLFIFVIPMFTQSFNRHST